MTYLQRNKGYLTWSKIKAYKTCTKLYKLMYVDWLGWADTKATRLWTAFHRLCEVWMDQFLKEYEVLEPRKRKWLTELPVLSNWDFTLIDKDYQEVKRQPLMDLKWDYDNEVEIKLLHRDKKFKATVDRLSIEKKQIRDWKLIADVNKFERDYLTEFWFDYIFQAAVYHLMVFKKYRVSCDFIFDVIDKKAITWSQSFMIPSIDLMLMHQEVDDIIDDLKVNKEFECKIDRFKCLKCPMYTNCHDSIQKEFVTIN